eukprot:m.99594 g.99594  ORF g.99594 m.99594 type:complete len:201 (+) comp13148_c1_seq1:1752-2354(+)
MVPDTRKTGAVCCGSLIVVDGKWVGGKYLGWSGLVARFVPDTAPGCDLEGRDSVVEVADCTQAEGKPLRHQLKDQTRTGELRVRSSQLCAKQALVCQARCECACALPQHASFSERERVGVVCVVCIGVCVRHPKFKFACVVWWRQVMMFACRLRGGMCVTRFNQFSMKSNFGFSFSAQTGSSALGSGRCVDSDFTQTHKH